MENLTPLCPLCMKNGVTSKVRPYQINFEEGVWICESEKCSWPIGYQKLDIFKRNALNCDWEKDPPNPPKGCVSPLTGLYTPPMTPAEGESCKESTDTAGTECSSQLSAEDPLTRTQDKNEVSDPTKDLQLLKLFDVEGTSTEETWTVSKSEDESMDFWIETDFNCETTDSETLPIIIEYCDNQVIQNCERLCVNTTVTHATKDLDTIDNTCKELNPSEQRSELSNKLLEGDKQVENVKVLSNNAASSLDVDIEMLLSSDLVGGSDVEQNIQLIFDDSEFHDLGFLLS